MALSRMHSVALLGLDALPVEVEVDVGRSDKTTLIIVGCPIMPSENPKTASLPPSKIPAMPPPI